MRAVFTALRQSLVASAFRRKAALLVLCAGAATILQADRQKPSAPDAWPVRFTDIADRAGLRHASIYGGVETKRFILETNGCGTGFIDYDRDGWIDASCSAAPGSSSRPDATCSGARTRGLPAASIATAMMARSRM